MQVLVHFCFTEEEERIPKQDSITSNHAERLDTDGMVDLLVRDHVNAAVRNPEAVSATG